MKLISRISFVFALAISAYAQINTFTATTLSSAATVRDNVLTVASATGITASVSGNDGSQLYIIDPGNARGEIATVTAVSSTSITVIRTASARVAHASGAVVLIGKANWYQKSDPVGTCTASTVYASPWINTINGRQWLCSSVTGTWVPGFNNEIEAKAPTAAVASAAGLITPSGPLFHVTGTAAITGFTLPVGFVGGQICVVPDGIFTTTNANNIALASTAVVSKRLCFAYDSVTAKFYPSY